MIRSLSPFPFVLPNGELKPGIVSPINPVCAICHRRECSENGFGSRENGLPKSCFKGLRYVYVEDFEGDSVVWNGFLLKGSKYPTDYKTLIKNGYQLDASAIQTIVSLFSSGERIEKDTLARENKALGTALHDLKHLISALMRTVETNDVRIATEEIPSETWQTEIMRRTIKSVYNILGVVKSQISMSDYILAPEATDFTQEVEIDIYKLFEKNVYIYNTLAEMQKKTIRISAPYGYVKAIRVLKENFVLLPGVLLQNAIKYSLDDTETVVEVTQQRGQTKISVNSTGSIIPPLEQARIWHKGEQYIHSNDTNKGGGGYGLFLAKSICTGSGFTIHYEGSPKEMFRGIPIGENRFVITEL